MILITEKLSFLYQKKNLVKLKQKTTFALMLFSMKINQPFQSTFKIKNLKIQINENKSHYVYIKNFDRFMFHKTKNF